MEGLILSFLPMALMRYSDSWQLSFLSLLAQLNTWQSPIDFTVFHAPSNIFTQIIHQEIYLTLIQMLTTHYHVIMLCPLGFLNTVVYKYILSS